MTRREHVRTELSQAERRDVVENDRRARARERNASSYHQFASGEAEITRGRFTAHEKTRVIGSGPIEYPPQPADSPWTGEQALEPPLAYSEPFEIEKSLPETTSRRR
jgi:hypothetical protein